MIARINNCDVVAGTRKLFEQIFHVGHSSPGRQALNNMMCRFSNDLAVVPPALRLGTEGSRGLSKNISRYSLGGSKRRGQVLSARRFP
jgi:hypothetical protein